MCRALLVLLVALLGAACEVNATVDVRVRENGSGVVRLLVNADAEAVKAAESGGVPLEQAVRLDDLADAGWDVGAWARAEDGSASIVLTKRFESVEQVAGIIREASGGDGPLQRVRATLESGFLATDYGLTGRVDLEHVTTGVPTDTELLASLRAQSVDPNVIDQQLLAQLKASFGLLVVVRLPGEARQTFTAKPGAVTPIDASASVRATFRILFLVAALGFAVLAVLMWRRGGRRRGRRGRSRPENGSRPDPTPRRGQGSGRGEDPRRGPHVPLPHVPLPHVPHPHLPGRPRPGAPPPPNRRPRPPV